jgi:hypothetical protein
VIFFANSIVDASNCPSGTGTCLVTPSTALAYGSGSWWVQTKNAVGAGPWSSGMSFTISPPPPLPPRRCTGQSEAPVLCAGDNLHLSAECSTISDCCQCGGPEYQWSRCVGQNCVVVKPWSTELLYDETPGRQ